MRLGLVSIMATPDTVKFVHIDATSFHAPIHTVSESNAHEHWRVRQRRAKNQRATAALGCRYCLASRPALPCRIVLTRCAARLLDSDNLHGSLKHCRDGVADWLGIDDRDPRVEWVCMQVKATKATSIKPGVRIEVRAC